MTWFCVNPKLEQTVCHLLQPVVALLEEGHVTDIAGNYEDGRVQIYLDKGSGPMLVANETLTAGELEVATLLIASDAGKYLEPEAPFLNCILPCGFRYHAALPPVSDGARFSIRTHYRHDWCLRDFATEEQVAQITRKVLHLQNILIAGATGSGKTSLLSALIRLIPVEERVMVLEDEHELQVRPGNVLRGRASTTANLKRQVFEALRDRPDRIIVGEVRGPEAYDMLDAFATGHQGCMATIHANDCQSALTRLQRLAGCDDELIEEAIDVVLYLGKAANGKRMITEIYELHGPATTE